MSIKGFEINGNIERYDYNSLENLPGVSGGSSEWTVVEDTFVIEGGESGVSGAFSLTPKTPSVTEFTEAYLWAKLSGTKSGTYRINFDSGRNQIVPAQQINTVQTRLVIHVMKMGDFIFAHKVDSSNMSSSVVFNDTTTLGLNFHWATVDVNETITSVGGVMYR